MRRARRAVAATAAAAAVLLAPQASPGGTASPNFLPPPLDCDRRDYVTHSRPTYLASPNAAGRANATPAAALAAYLETPILPETPRARDWVAHETPAPGYAYHVVRAPGDPSRILGVAGVERVDGSWRVTLFGACGEYLYPGSLGRAE